MEDFRGSVISLVSPVMGSVVSLHTPIQLKYLRMPREERRVYLRDASCRAELGSEGFWPRPVILEWCSECACGVEYVVMLSTSEDFSAGSCEEYRTVGCRLEVTNLLMATRYYWRVQCGEAHSPVWSFVTSDLAPRLLKIPNLWNCRDLGGRVGLDGRRVKQNIALRTGGFTQNSEKILYTMEELQQDPKFNARVAEIQASTKLLQESPKTAVPYLLEGAWTVFRPPMESFGEAELEQVDALTEIPQEFLGAKAVAMSVNEEFGVVMDEFRVNLPAVLMKEFEAPEDGAMPFTCGADWFWYLRLNGVTIYDRRKGNNKPSDKDSYTLFLPVKAGRNLLTVYLGSGGASFAWYCAPVPAGTPLESVIASGLSENESILPSFCKQGKKDAQGNQLYTKGELVLNDEGKHYLLETIGMKSEIDLRGPGECFGLSCSPVGSQIRWFHIPSNAYDGMMGKPGRDGFREVFKIFLDESNYPIVFHCIGGQDRTGSVAFILNALMGVSEEELYLDWECSGFWNTQTEFNLEMYIDRMVDSFKKLPGKNLCEQAEYYVKSLGFTQEDIQHLRECLMLNLE